MKATKITYQRTFNTGNYSNVKIGVEVEVEEGEEAKNVLEKAKKFVNDQDPNNEIILDNKDIISKEEAEIEYERCKLILERPHVFSHAEYIEAASYVAKYELENSESDDLPF